MEYKSSSIQKQYIKGVFSLSIYLGLILIFTFGVLTPHKEKKAKHPKKSIVVDLEGTIDRYPILMTLNLNNIKNKEDKCEVTGKYRYTASGDGSMLSLHGEKSASDLVLKEYDSNGQQTGTFNGTLEKQNRSSSYEYTGTFTNSKGKSFKFALKSN